MKTRRVILIAVGLLAAAGGAWLFASWWRDAGRRPECALCDRPLHPGTAFHAVVAGTEIWACCPRCGLSLCAGKEKPAEMTATDFPTGRRVPAESCVYVDGSDLVPCCSPEVIIVGDKMPCERCFDRCYPSVIAFASREDAVAFTKEHGGSIVSLAALEEEAKQR